uniref:NAD(P)H-hydrate epimerase n=1 Tax=Talaromyces marneffei PM1 TaxID=1077442 RepID=A0A093VXD1_TALMA
MASDFVGYTVLVTLSSPPNSQIRGTVANILGQRLTLHDDKLLMSAAVTLLWNGQHFPSYTIDAAGIADLEVSSSQAQAPSHHPSAPNVPQTASTQLRYSQPPPVPQRQPFVDPAIVSFSAAPSNPVTKQTPVAALLSRTDSFLGSTSSVLSVDTAHPPQTTERHDSTVTAILTEPFSSITLDKAVDIEEEAVNEVPFGNSGKGSTKRGKRGGRNKGQDHSGNGWRQTAFVEPARPRLHTGYPADDDVIQSRGKHRKNNRKAYAENSNGWATEDATDIQELGDFDFQGNLSKFDKRRVFDEIRNDDTTADEDRLVSFNKRPKPGTNGGKNLHWSENVLDSTLAQWNSEAGETETETSDDKFSSGNYSNRDRSKPPGKAQLTKKSSLVLGQAAMSASFGSVGRGSIPSPRNISPMPNRQSGRVSPPNGANGPSTGSLRLTTTNRLCPTVSPLQMLEVEQLAVTELGLTEDMIVENAGRGIAEAAVGRLGSDAAAPAVLVLTGNHRTGGRAIAAARHLKNRGHRVTLCLLGLEHETELLENCRKQLEIFKKIGGRVLRWEELSARLLTPDFSVDLVIDALFGMHIAFEDLRSDDQATACEMIAWVNRSNLVVISVDIPSGISAATGDVGIIQGSRLSMVSDFVVCLGAPKTGVMQALQSGEGNSWQITVADIGISHVVWRKYGTRRRHGVDFGNRWVVNLKYQPAAA